MSRKLAARDQEITDVPTSTTWEMNESQPDISASID
jgi:hypothetical protein